MAPADGAPNGAQEDQSMDIDLKRAGPTIVATGVPGDASENGNDAPLDNETVDAERATLHKPDPAHNYFSSLQWTPDGTTLLLASTSNHQLSTYILPPTLLTSPELHLSAYSTLTFPSAISASAISPAFSLSEPSSCIYLAAPRSLPIRLVSPFTPNILASYPLYNEQREQWLTPHSLLFDPREHGKFYAGKENEICAFDLGRHGEGPFASVMTGRKWRKQRVGVPIGGDDIVGEGKGGLSRGIVSAMAMNLDGHLAVGTFTGEVGLLDTRAEDEGNNIVKLPLPGDVGSGVTGLKFHPDPSRQNYLVAASRRSETLEVFDVRNTGNMLASLQGRCSMTQQRLGFDIVEEGEVWAGGIDGFVRVWKGLGQMEGDVWPSREIEAHNDAVSGCGLHPGGAGVLATCAGSRKIKDSDVEDLTFDEGYEQDASLKVWNLQS